MEFKLTELQKIEIYLSALNGELREQLKKWSELKGRTPKKTEVGFVCCPWCEHNFMKDWDSLPLSLDKVKAAYYQATNLQTETIEIIKRLFEELNKP